MELAEIEKRIERYEKLAQKKYHEYQMTGEPRYDRDYEKYSELATIYRYAYKYKSDSEDDVSRRIRNISAFIEEHIVQRNKATYTKGEVIDLAERMKLLVY